MVHAPPLPTEAVDNRVVSLVHSVDDETLTTLFAGARPVAPCPYHRRADEVVTASATASRW